MTFQCRECLMNRSDTVCLLTKSNYPYEMDVCADCRPSFLAGEVDGLQVQVSGEFVNFDELALDAQAEILGSGGVMVQEWIELVRSCIADIGDDYRSGEDDEDDEPSMDLTVGFTPESSERDASWGFQTGDNSFTGGAYSHPHWAVVTLDRESDPVEVAKEIKSQIDELVHS